MKHSTIAFVFAALMGSAGLAQEREEDAVLLVQMTYDRAGWQAKPIRILPCPAPSKPSPFTRQRSVMLLADADRRVVARRLLMNPRIILVEDPEEYPRLAEKLEFVARMPYARGAVEFQFFESEEQYRDPEKGQEPDVSIARADLRDIAAKFEESGMQERASCQIIRPKPENEALLGDVTDNAISPDTLMSLMANDPELIIDRGIEMDLDPDAARKLAYTYRGQWGSVQIDEKDVERFLDRYKRAFEDRR